MERSIKGSARIAAAILFGALFIVKNAGCDNNIYFINSDETNYKENNVVCRGNVIIMYDNRIISADEITYDQTTEDIFAKGKVIIKDEKQNVYFLDSVSIKKNFRNGSGTNIKVIMQDKARLAADKCTIKNGIFELENAIYTPCYQCVAFDELSWQAKASNVSLNLEDTISYENLIIEALGTGVFYLPYLSVPSPKIKKKTGFLAPKFSVSSKNGFGFMPQYFINLSEQQELILKPIITQKIGSVAWLYYGTRFKNGEFDIDTSITGTKSVRNVENGIGESYSLDKIKRSGYRGHIFSNFKYDINEMWRCNAAVNLVSDAYYLRRFPFLRNTERVLETKGIVEGFDGDNYTSFKTSMFQTRYNDDAPKALPLIERNFSTNLFDGTLNADLMFIDLFFHHGRDARKGAGNISWTKEFLVPYGNIFELKLLTALRMLKVTEKEHSDYDSFLDATPQVSLTWKWPLLLSSDIARAVVTPIAGIISAGNKKHIDIFEDQFTEINDINFLENGKSISPYNIDYGSRFCYGLKMSLFSKDGDNLAYFTLGRTTEITDVVQKSAATGLQHKNSNIVTALDLFLTNEITFSANGSYSTRSNNWLKFESGIKANYEKFNADVLVFNGKQCLLDPFFSHIQDKNNRDNENNQNEKYKGAMLDLGWQANKKLRFRAGIVFGSENNRLIKHNIGFEYKNECISMNVLIERTKYKSGDIKPETSFTFVITLKNLG